MIPYLSVLTSITENAPIPHRFFVRQASKGLHPGHALLELRSIRREPAVLRSGDSFHQRLPDRSRILLLCLQKVPSGIG